MTGERVIDSHHHFWDPERGDYPWLMEARFAPIRRRWTPQDLVPVLEANGVTHTIVVQTWSSQDETEEFLDLAARHEFIAGVVGWVDLTSPQVARTLHGLRAHPGSRWLVGIRHQVHDEPDPDWLLRDDVRHGLAAVFDAGLVFDLLIRPRELPAALATVRAFPSQRFVVDHIAKPRIRDGGYDEWRRLLAPLAEHPQVYVKASGLVTEADWSGWDHDELVRYVTEVIELFGPDRTMFGSDWPVCLVAADYNSILAIVRDAVSTLSPAARSEVLSLTATRCYGLEM